VTSAPRPVAADRLADELADLVDRSAASCGHVLRVAVDGHPAAGTAALADALVDPLRLLGHPVLRVSAAWFLRPASVRLERGRTDPDSFYDDWLDVAALRREVLDPLGPGGSGRYLPTLWDPGTDRSTRATYAAAPPNAVLVLDGTLLLGRGLPLDLTVHLRLSAGARQRRVSESSRWALPAYTRYEREVEPERIADVVVRVDDPRHPALSFPTG
jgi:hypothetical protein